MSMKVKYFSGTDTAHIEFTDNDVGSGPGSPMVTTCNNNAEVKKGAPNRPISRFSGPKTGV
jgi:hypothetical protein